MPDRSGFPPARRRRNRRFAFHRSDSRRAGPRCFSREAASFGGASSPCQRSQRTIAPNERQATPALARIGIPARPTPDPGSNRNRASENRAAVQPSFQVLGQIAGRLVARLRFALETTRTNRFQVAVERGRERTQPRRRIRRCLPNHGENIRPDEGRTISEEVKQDRAQAVNVGRGRELAGGALCLLRCNVTGRAEGRQGTGQIAFGSVATWPDRSRSRAVRPWQSSRMLPGCKSRCRTPCWCA